MAPVGRVTLSASLSCPDDLQLFLRLNLRIVNAFNIPADENVLLGSLDAGGRLEAEGARDVSFGPVSGLVDERLKGRVDGVGVSGSYEATVKLSDRDGNGIGVCHTDKVDWSGRSAPGRIYAERRVPARRSCSRSTGDGRA